MLLMAALAGCLCGQLSSILAFTVPSRMLTPAGLDQVVPGDSAWGMSRSLDERVARPTATARHIFGLGTSEILVILGVGVLFFGPETLKGLAKEAGKAAGDLKEVPQAFQQGMDETDKTKKDDDKADKDTESKEPKPASKE